MIESLFVSANLGNHKSYQSHNIQTIGSCYHSFWLGAVLGRESFLTICE